MSSMERIVVKTRVRTLAPRKRCSSAIAGRAGQEVTGLSSRACPEFSVGQILHSNESGMISWRLAKMGTPGNCVYSAALKCISPY